MNDIENKILQFSSLSPEERRDVEAYVDAHPEWQAFLDEVKALEAMRHDMPFLRAVSDDVLAYYAIASHSELGASPALRRMFEDVEARLATDAELRERYESLVQRLGELTHALNPSAQFESLSGFRLEADEAVNSQPAEASRQDASSPEASGGDARIVTLPRAVRWAVAALVLVALSYGGLYGVSHMMQSDLERLALVELSETQIQGYQLTTRGAPAAEETQSTDALYLEALQTLRAARESTLGLFPRYDSDRLARAEQLLQQVIEREASRSFLQIEAYFFLGKVHLAQGNIEAARSNFQTVAIHEGRRSPEAVEILAKLQQVHPAHGQSYVG